MKLEDKQTYFVPAPIIVSPRWAKVTLTCNEGGDPIHYLPMDSHGGAAQTLVHHDNGATSYDPPWESAPIVQPGATVELDDSVYVMPLGGSHYRAEFFLP